MTAWASQPKVRVRYWRGNATPLKAPAIQLHDFCWTRPLLARSSNTRLTDIAQSLGEISYRIVRSATRSSALRGVASAFQISVAVEFSDTYSPPSKFSITKVSSICDPTQLSLRSQKVSVTVALSKSHCRYKLGNTVLRSRDSAVLATKIYKSG